MRSLRSRSLPLCLLVTAWLACGHTHQATDKPQTDSEPSQPKPSSGEEHRKSAGNSSRPARHPTSSPETAPPIASSPAGLLREDAIARIQDRLKAKGYLQHTEASGKLDGVMEEALRAFQRDCNLPATGIPDDETVRQLGLPASQIFRASAGSANP